MKTTYYLRTLGASNIEKATVSVKKVGVKMPGDTVAATMPEPKTQEYTADERAACSLEAMLNGGECEACQ